MKPSLRHLIDDAQGIMAIVSGTPEAVVELQRLDAALARMRAKGHDRVPDVELGGQAYGYAHLQAVRDALVSGQTVYGRDVTQDLVRAGGHLLHRGAMASDAAERVRRARGSHAVILPELPTVKKRVVFHVGTQTFAQKGTKKPGSSLEGEGLSVSEHPRAWMRVAQLGGHATWALSRTDGQPGV